MLFSKFNSRPPFERKKPTELYDIVDKIKSYPKSCCENCCGNRAIVEKPSMQKSSSIPRPAKSKDLEKFQRTSPSIQTLYRNSNVCKLMGRNVPKHNLMKKLLQNLDSDGDDSRKSFAKTKKKKFFVQREVIRTDFDVNCKARKSGDCKVESKTKMSQKVDKQTSTTGLSFETLHSANCCKYCKSKLASGNFVVEEPKVLRSYSFGLPPIISQRSLRSEQNNFRKIIKRLDIDPPIHKATSKNINRGKTFVQIQVERLDKQLKFNAKHPHSSYIGSRKHKNTSEIKPNKKIEKEAKLAKDKSRAAAYLELMNKVKEACPQLHLSNNSIKSETGWSDYSAPEECVKFPKETRTAMDQRLYERRPLSKFTMVQHCRPAVNIINDDRCSGDLCRQAEPDIKEPKCSKEKYKVISNRSKLSMPCKKNLLCDKGEYHTGTCGYTHCNRNKVIY
ncbi:unnamed protein product [Ceutorhynchus assimilis]|uniref:Uncharacterized protein n=1 Tax=Ceutorhynchus assimilis TaxID=467358 RepID=A0A9N9N110_9CUCU|nr:unnamed protein product [Ceutorhynchus assimilis]